MTESPPPSPFGRPPLLIVGASARAAAFAALRAGFEPVCLDRYGDADLAAVARVQRVDPYPDGIIAALADWPVIPAMYVGAIENEGAVIDALAARGPLLGNPRNVVEEVRRPERLVEAFRELRLPCLDVCHSDQPPPRDGNWLIKPRRSAGGRRIAVWDAATPVPTEPHYFQQRALGDSYSAVFVAPPDRSDVRFVGLTRQMVGHPLLNAAPFGWCGSAGPETLPVGIEHLVRRIGNYLSWKFNLCGLFGCDFVVDGDGMPRLTEVNPRYPASTEVLEHALHVALLRDHAAAFGGELPAARPPVTPAVDALGKFVLFSDRDFVAPAPADWLQPAEWLHAGLWNQTPLLADVPQAGTPIAAGQPICTVCTVGKTTAECLARFPDAVNSVKSRLFS
jgi:predicted ATP-grasp superfamily ATP-dependent carboligase